MIQFWLRDNWVRELDYSFGGGLRVIPLSGSEPASQYQVAPDGYRQRTIPAFFNSDLIAQKTVPFGEKSLQFRIAAFNFLNHPLPSFSSRFPKEANLQFYDPNYSGFSGVQLANGVPSGANCSAARSQCFGYAGYKTGRRVIEVAIRYNF